VKLKVPVISLAVVSFVETPGNEFAWSYWLAEFFAPHDNTTTTENPAASYQQDFVPHRRLRLDSRRS
jgi:hypothetical protein